MKHIYLFAFAVLFSINITAQTSLYEKAFYITLQDDTIHGYIRQDNDYNLISEAVFKKTLDSKDEISLTPTSTKKFVFENGRRFERLEIIHKKGESVITNFTFGKPLAKGICNLYNISKTRFDEDVAFALEKDCKVYVLKQENRFFENEAGEIDYEKKVIDYRYLGIIKVILGDCDSIKALLPAITLNEMSLSAIVQKYNKCIDISKYPSVCKPIETFQKVNRVETKHAIFANFYSIEKEKFVTVKSVFGCGYTYNYFNPDIVRLLSFSTGLHFCFLNYTFNPVYSFYSYNSSFTKMFISIPLTMNFNIIKKKDVNFYSFFGFNPYYSRVVQSKNFNTFWIDNNIKIKSSLYMPYINSAEFAAIIGVGFVYKRLFLQCFYETQSLLQASVGYSF